ncbi:hypothetical protein [Salinicola rhizosphaerae]|uniref:Uncharacterized protein n=1 Tax=Salinicola rhizosphaerae TaxID=1443141 RepID=A0ABQ3DRY0_9GAMM|nr:hypothetical protein [Salinicola rhizosphaerae]GHB13613.1 hypothetical protein GCM10009038_09810 [Salinicola rhizosphaerae]
MAANETAASQQYGTAITEPALRQVRLGDVSFAWQSGALRWLTVGDVEVVRGIAAVLRDPQWGTHAPVVDDERMTITDRHASLTQDFHLPPQNADEVANAKPLLRGRLLIEASERHVTVDLVLDALIDFTTARSGLSVLLPLAGIVGEEIQVWHTDGRQETARLPWLISPSQPLFDIRQLQLSPARDVTPNLTVTLAFDGDVFEMEDQRNWSDASFKIYNRPLAWPTPYVLKAGETLNQRVTVSLNGGARTELELGESEPSIHAPTPLTMPSIGCGVWLDRLDDLERLARQLDAVAPRHLDVLLDLRKPRAIDKLAGLMTIAAEHDIAVWFYVICEDHEPEASLSALAQRLERLPDVKERPLAGMLVTPAAYLESYQPDGDWPAGTSPAEALAAARKIWPEMTLGGGVPTYFTELNRCRPDPAAIDFITHAVSPIVHAADDRSVMEALESVPYLVASCRALAPTVPYRITTTVIGAWTNPYGKSLTPNDGRQRVTLSDNDPRQHGQFAAAWTLGFAARAAESGVEALTFSSLGPPFDIGEMPLRPVGHVIAGLARASGQRLCRSPLEESPNSPASLATLAWRIGATEANPTATETRGISEGWMVNLAAEPVMLGLKRVDIVDLALLEAAHDGFQPAPELQARLVSGESVTLAGFAVIKLRWRDLSISTD